MYYKNYKKLIVDINTDYRSIIKIMTTNKIGFVIVINENKKFVGVINDGDIRRFLFNKDDKISTKKIINTNAKFVFENKANDIDLKLLKNFVFIPIIKSDHTISGCLHINSSLNSELLFNNSIIIMAGGEGKRISKITKTTPKPLIKIKNKTLLEHIINNFISFNFQNITVVTHYKHQKIKNFLREKYNQDISIFKEKIPMGSGGVFRKKNDFSIKNLSYPLILLNSDIYCNFNPIRLLEFYFAFQADLLICIKKKNVDIKYGIVEFENTDYKSSIEKPSFEIYVNSGIYIFGKKSVSYAKSLSDYDDFMDLIKKIKKRGLSIKVFEINENWYDIGTYEELMECKKIEE